MWLPLYIIGVLNMNYNETIEYIHSTPKFARELGNTLLLKLLEKLDNPHKGQKYIHIAGTNGKGSTATMLAEILKQSGYKVGLYTSPYIEVFNERIKINGENISNDDLALIVTLIREIIETYDTPVSEFALDTAAAFYYFKEQKCDFIVLETGMGGRLDATNVIEENIATVLTSISLDHTQYLGQTIEEITEEKCGIIKKNSSVICYPNMIQSALTVINNKINEMNAKLYISQKPDENKPVFTYNNKEYILGLNGDFQKYNASTVLKTVEVLRTNGVQIPEKAIEEGLKKATHMARFEFFGENIILDGGHNRDAMEELAKSLKKIKKPICLCIAMMKDKDYSECIKIVSGVITNVVTCEIDMPRCCKSEMLAKEFNKNGVNAHSYQRPEDALNKALEIAGDDGLVCICGSLYLAGYIRPFLKEIINRFT